MTALGIAIIIAAGLVILLRPTPPLLPPPKPAESPAL
jgi:hypothetical protein